MASNNIVKEISAWLPVALWAALIFHFVPAAEYFVQAADLSLVLCFFNLIPVPPLDGSHIMRVATGMSHETYANFARFGFIIVIVLLQIRPVRMALSAVTYGTLDVLLRLFGVN